ncbi:MAG: hypothetical protein VKJ04_07480 [Vampirovibrionales bacterium]|nr:hypothetical protein [Vampirovibrionales bacterium]
MGFEGIQKAALFNAGGPINPYLADQAAKADKLKKPQVTGTERDENVTGVYKELPHYGDEDEERQQEHLSEEEYEQLLLFARMRGIMNLAFEQGEHYQFQVNPQTGLVDVVADSTGQSVLSLTPLELMEMSQRIHRYAGLLTDRSG